MKTFLVILTSVLLVLSSVSVALAASDTVQASVSVAGTLVVSAVDFNLGTDVVPGTTTTPVTVAVQVDSNAPYTLKTIADSANFADGSKTFAVSNMKWSTDSWVTETAYSNTVTGTITSIGAAPGTIHNVDHKVSVPADAEAGTYNVGVTLTATHN